MGELTDKLKGAANRVVGGGKRAAGVAVDRPDLEAEGGAQQVAGDLQQVKGAIKGALGDKI